MIKPTFMILTVGTGTAGRHSNLVQGLINTILAQKPAAYWLVPSTSEDSTTIADLIREQVSETFRPWSPDQLYHCVSLPDDLENCRSSVRQVIDRVAAAMGAQEHLLINPTSGTKQMSVGAALAALDAGVGELVFTVGERADGVVKTGTEQLTYFDASRWRAEQALMDAKALFQAGAYTQARMLLEPHQPRQRQLVQSSLLLCELAEAWSRRNFTAAANRSRRLGLQPYAQRYDGLAAEAKHPTAAVVAEALALAEHFCKIHHFELAAAGYYRAIEIGLKRRVETVTGCAYPWKRSDLAKMKLPNAIADKLKKAMASRMLGVNQLAQILQARKDRMGNLQPVWHILSRRNRFTHDLDQVDPRVIQNMGTCTRKLLEPLNLPDPIGLPSWP